MSSGGLELLESRVLFDAVLRTTLLSDPGVSSGADTNAVIDAAGNIFTTVGREVVELPAGGTTVKVLATFSASGTNTDAIGGPYGDLILNSAGDLFGLADEDVGSVHGTLWELPAGSNAIVSLAEFPYPNFLPTSLTSDAAGDLFGTLDTLYAGDVNSGSSEYSASLFEYPAGGPGLITTPLGGQPTEYYTDDDVIAADATGNVFGVRPSADYRVNDYDLYEIAHGTTAVTTLATLTLNNDDAPDGLALDSTDGSFVLVTGDGQVLRAAIGDMTGTLLGTLPTTGSGQILDPLVTGNGDIFVLVVGGEENGNGYIYEVPAAGGAPVDLASLPDNPLSQGGDLTPDTSGDLYGTYTTTGGQAMLFELTGTSATPTSTNTSGLTLTAAKTTLPTSLVAGAKLEGSVTVDVDNATGATLKGMGTIDLYATNAAGKATLVGTVKKGLKLANGSSTPVTIAAKAIVLPAGTYAVLPTLTVGSDKSMAATGPTIAVAPATVTLAAAVTAASPSTVAPGKTVTLTLSLTNTGNVNSTGAATVNVTLTDTTSGAVVVIPAIATKTTVKFGGKPVKFKLKLKVPVGTTAASYDPTVTFAQDGTSTTVIGTTAITVS
jgi:uncharacterized repeat protein (TIGR01451 family)